MLRQETERSETGSLALGSLRKAFLSRVFELKLNKDNKLAFQELRADAEWEEKSPNQASDLAWPLSCQAIFLTNCISKYLSIL